MGFKTSACSIEGGKGSQMTETKTDEDGEYFYTNN